MPPRRHLCVCTWAAASMLSSLPTHARERQMYEAEPSVSLSVNHRMHAGDKLLDVSCIASGLYSVRERQHPLALVAQDAHSVREQALRWHLAHGLHGEQKVVLHARQLHHRQISHSAHVPQPKIFIASSTLHMNATATFVQVAETTTQEAKRRRHSPAPSRPTRARGCTRGTPCSPALAPPLRVSAEHKNSQPFHTPRHASLLSTATSHLLGGSHFALACGKPSVSNTGRPKVSVYTVVRTALMSLIHF
jgi:phage gp46-like protein